MPLITARHSDGSVQTYLNMCRHRGGRVEQDARGNKRVFMCRYHGWSYERDGGGLRNVPYEDSFEPNDHAHHGLQRFRTEARHGLIRSEERRVGKECVRPGKSWVWQY